jgi:hypothetical protein
MLQVFISFLKYFEIDYLFRFKTMLTLAVHCPLLYSFSTALTKPAATCADTLGETFATENTLLPSSLVRRSVAEAADNSGISFLLSFEFL